MVENPLHALLHDAVEELVSREPLGRVGFPKGGCIVTPEDIDTDPPATDRWESTDAIHGPLYLSWWAATAIKRADPPEGALEVAALCGGSYTDPWESTEAIHGKLYATLEDAADQHCGQPVGLGCNDYFAD